MNGDSPVVSVIMPLYNTRAYVGEAIESALAQTFAALEVIVVDDGSTDGGGAIVSELAARDRRVTCIRQEHRGPASARNVGISAARGSAIAFLDSDDLWLPAKLARQVPLLTGNVVVHGNAYVFPDGEPVGETCLGAAIAEIRAEDTLGSLLEENRIALLTTVAPRELLLASGCFDPSLEVAEDYDLWLRLAAGGTTFRYVPEPLAAYRVRGGSTGSDPIRMTAGRLRAYENLASKAEPGLRPRVRARARRERRLLAGELRLRARGAVLAGDTAAGRRDLWRAVRTAPSWWRTWLLAGALSIPFGLRPLASLAARRERLQER